MNLITRLLRKNVSSARITGFVLSNFIGLLIIGGGLQFYSDARSLWEDDDSFIRSDLMVVNRKVTSGNTLGEAATFSSEDIRDIESQPWVRKVGVFTPAAYHVNGRVGSGDRTMSTDLFFESIPDEFIDVSSSAWHYEEGSPEVPIILSKDYLALYNFGFAAGAGLPQLSEDLMKGIPLNLTLIDDSGSRRMQLTGQVVGFSNRLNTILVPQSFIEITNRELGNGKKSVSRLAVDVSSPGDIAIAKYLDAHRMEQAGDKSSSSAAFMLKVVTGIVLAIGIVITVLSLFILMLSISLLMEKSRSKLNALLLLGTPLKLVTAPYKSLIAIGCACSFLISAAGILALRAHYLPLLEGMGARSSGIAPFLIATATLTLVITLLNFMAVDRRVRAAWRN